MLRSRAVVRGSRSIICNQTCASRTTSSSFVATSSLIATRAASSSSRPTYEEQFGSGPLWFKGLLVAATVGVGYAGYRATSLFEMPEPSKRTPKEIAARRHELVKNIARSLAEPQTTTSNTTTNDATIVERQSPAAVLVVEEPQPVTSVSDTTAIVENIIEQQIDATPIKEPEVVTSSVSDTTTVQAVPIHGQNNADRPVARLEFTKPLLIMPTEESARRVFQKYGSQVLVTYGEGGIGKLDIDLETRLYLAPALVYFYNKNTGGLELYILSEEQLSSLEATLADISEGKLQPEAMSQKPDAPLSSKVGHPTRAKPVVLTRDNFEETIRNTTNKDIAVFVHFGQEAIDPKIEDLVQVHENDKSVMIATYDSSCNLPFPESLLRYDAAKSEGGEGGTDLVQTEESFFQVYPRNATRENAIRFPIRDSKLLDIIFTMCVHRRTDLKRIAELVRAGSLVRTAQDVMDLDALAADLVKIRTNQVAKDHPLYMQQEKNKKKKKKKKKEEKKMKEDKVLSDLKGYREEAEALKKAMTRPLDEYKKEVKALSRRFSNSMYDLQSDVLRNIVRLPKENFKEELQKLIERKGEKDVVVFFSRKGCMPCFELSFFYSRLAGLLPEYTWAWADADAVDLPVTPRCFVYNGATGEEMKRLDFDGCVRYFSQKGIAQPPPPVLAPSEPHETRKEDLVQNKVDDEDGKETTPTEEVAKKEEAEEEEEKETIKE